MTGTITVGEAPEMVTVSPDGSRVFVTCADGVYVINAASAASAQAPGTAAPAATAWRSRPTGRTPT